MNILFCAAEAAPFIKVGGLADVIGSLPSALHELGHDVRVMMPFYGVLRDRGIVGSPVGKPFTVISEGEKHSIQIFQTALPPHGTPVYLIGWPGQFAGEAYDTKQGLEDLREGVRRFFLYSLAAAQAIEHLPWPVEMLHCHDWHSGGVPVFREALKLPHIPTVFSIHNLSIQGKWGAEESLAWVGLEKTAHPLLDVRDTSGNVNMLLWGVMAADVVATVSPQYAREVLTPEFGDGLDSFLRQRGVQGIVNGIDADVFNPATDHLVHITYDQSTVATGKAENKTTLQASLGLDVNEKDVLYAFIGRLTPQKGVDVFLGSLHDILRRGHQLVVLASGEAKIEQELRDAEKKYPGRFRVILRFDAAIGQQLYAGADFLLMPSRFEPCGLGQLIALRYGTIPIVHDTGGLHDTIVDLRRDPVRGNGFIYSPNTPENLTAACVAAETLLADPAQRWAVVQRSMAADYSWYTSAQQYGALYTTLLHSHHQA